MVVDFYVRVRLAEITWSFFSSVGNTSKKRFLTNSLLFAPCAGSKAKGAVRALDEALEKDSISEMAWASV
jgi:hypothetical protein